jgi:hypothetical protein
MGKYDREMFNSYYCKHFVEGRGNYEYLFKALNHAQDFTDLVLINDFIPDHLYDRYKDEYNLILDRMVETADSLDEYKEVCRNCIKFNRTDLIYDILDKIDLKLSLALLRLEEK